MFKFEFVINNADEAARAAAIMAGVADAFGAATVAPVPAPVAVAVTEQSPKPETATRTSRKKVDPVAAYEAATGTTFAETAAPPAPPVVETAATLEAEVAAVETAAAAAAPVETAAGIPTVTLEMVRDLIRVKGVLWGRDALKRYDVPGFGAMTAEQLQTIYAELQAPAAAGVA